MQPSEPPASEQRLVREARAMARLNHPNVVEVLDMGRHRGRHDERVYIAMELVAGPTLRRWLRAPRSWQDVLGVFVPAGRALAAADLVHRDFKPSNVIVGDDGRVRVLDFGLARAATDTVSATAAPRPAAAGTQTSAAPAEQPLSERVTEDGVLLGTPAYMSPEQRCGDPATPRSDQFAFRIALYEALYGRHPFAGDTPPAMLQAKLHGRVVGPPRRWPVPAAVAAVVKRGLEADRSDRWATMADLVDALGRAQGRTQRRGLAVGAVAVAALTGWLTLTPGQASVDLRCAGGPSALADVWSTERAAAIEVAITGTGLGYASAAASRVSAGVERWAADWTAAYREACRRASDGTEAANEIDPASLDRAMLCLQRDLHVLDAHAERLESIDAEAVARSPSAVAELPDPERCLDGLDGLDGPTPPPDDVAADVEALGVELAHAESLRIFGEPTAALSRAQSIAERAEPLGYAPLIGDAKEMLATTLDDVGQRRDAEQMMLDAYFLAVDTSDDAAALARAAMLIDQSSRRPDGFSDAQKWYRRVTALAGEARSGPAARHLAFAHAWMATALRRAGRYDEALARARDGLARAEEVMGNEPSSMLHFYTGLAGPRSDRVAMAATNLGVAYDRAGRLEDAVRQWERATEILEAIDPDAATLATPYNDLGRTKTDAGELGDGRRLLERALARREAALGSEHPKVAAVRVNLAYDHRRSGALEQASLQLEQALSLLRVAHGEDGHPLATPLRMLADVRRQQGDCTAAREGYRAALAILGDVDPEGDAARARVGLETCEQAG